MRLVGPFWKILLGTQEMDIVFRIFPERLYWPLAESIVKDLLGTGSNRWIRIAPRLLISWRWMMGFLVCCLPGSLFTTSLFNTHRTVVVLYQLMRCLRDKCEIDCCAA